MTYYYQIKHADFVRQNIVWHISKFVPIKYCFKRYLTDIKICLISWKDLLAIIFIDIFNIIKIRDVYNVDYNIYFLYKTITNLNSFVFAMSC